MFLFCCDSRRHFYRIIEPSIRRFRSKITPRLIANNHGPRYPLSGLGIVRKKNQESGTKTLLWKRHRWERAYHRALTPASRREVQRGKTGHSYGTVSHSANAENVSDGDRWSQRTMAVRGRRLKPALQQILRLINTADRPFFAYDQTQTAGILIETSRLRRQNANATAATIIHFILWNR